MDDAAERFKTLPTIVLDTTHRKFRVSTAAQVVFQQNRGLVHKYNEGARVCLELLLEGPSFNGVLSRAYAAPGGDLTCYVASTIWLEPGEYTQTLRWLTDTTDNVTTDGLYLEPEEQLPAGSDVTRRLVAFGKGGPLHIRMSNRNNQEILTDVLCEYEAINQQWTHAYNQIDVYLGNITGNAPGPTWTDKKSNSGYSRAIVNKKGQLLKDWTQPGSPTFTVSSNPISGASSNATEHQMILTVSLKT